MDLTDEQWEVLEPLIPDPLAGKMDEADPGEILGTFSMASCGYCAPERPGRIYPNATLPTRPATAAFRGGSKKGCSRACSKRWPKTSKRGET
jgi:hypothetical protein